ncbi:hypothetical protein [Yinghuangia sp. YIM S09857]|uniref:hypothetical protein n=1 Tax=Yinghuangia sp. YIM S09857 TaxID=3436929 RepID=UPI003F52CDC6
MPVVPVDPVPAVDPTDSSDPVEPVEPEDAVDAVRKVRTVAPDSSEGSAEPDESDDPADADDEDDEDDEDDRPWTFVGLGIPDPDAASGGDGPEYTYPGGVGAAGLVPGGAAPFPDDGPTLPGQHWFEDDTRRRPWAFIALGVSLLVLVGVIVAIVVGRGGGKGSETSKRPTESTTLPVQAMPSEPANMRPVPTDLLSALAPRDVAATVFDGELMVAWSPPRSAEAVSGYLVTVQTPDGRVEGDPLHVARGQDLTAFFDDTDLCVVVTTVVSTAEGGWEVARGELVCPRPPTTRPATIRPTTTRPAASPSSLR